MVQQQYFLPNLPQIAFKPLFRHFDKAEFFSLPDIDFILKLVNSSYISLNTGPICFGYKLNLLAIDGNIDFTSIKTKSQNIARIAKT